MQLWRRVRFKICEYVRDVGPPRAAQLCGFLTRRPGLWIGLVQESTSTCFQYLIMPSRKSLGESNLVYGEASHHGLQLRQRARPLRFLGEKEDIVYKSHQVDLLNLILHHCPSVVSSLRLSIYSINMLLKNTAAVLFFTAAYGSPLAGSFYPVTGATGGVFPRLEIRDLEKTG